MRRSTVLTAIFAILAVVIGALIAILINGDNDDNDPDDAGSSSNSDLPTTYREAMDELVNGDDSPVAIVDGVEIPRSRLDSYLIMTGSADFNGPIPYEDADAYIEMLIDRQVLYAEALRRGFEPTDAEVLEYAEMTKENLETFLASGEGDSAGMAEMFESMEGTEFHYSQYDTSPLMLESFRQSMAVGALQSDYLNSAESAEYPDQADALEAFIAELRSEADIERLN